MTVNAIEIESLRKTYAGTKKTPPKEALKGINLSIEKGSIFGLLGPNGAGKSTIINVMAGLVVKTSGHVRIWGRDIDKDERNAKAAIGIVPQEINYDAFFTPRETLEIQSGLYGVPKAERRSMELLHLMGLEDKAESYTRSLSGGMKRRLMVAKAMVHSPPILVLDEPTAGVDVELRRQLWENVKALNKTGVTILLTTHYLEEAEELCDRIAIIHEGRIVANEEKESLVQRLDNKKIMLRLDRAIEKIPDTLAALGAQKEGRRTLTFCYTPSQTQVGQYIEAVQKAGFGISDITTDNSDLEDVFLQLTSG